MAKTRLADGSKNPHDRRVKRSRTGPKGPWALTAAKIDEAEKIIEQGGITYGMLSALLGVQRKTLYDWIRRGERESHRQQRWEESPEYRTRAEKAEHNRLKKQNQLYMEFSYRVKRAMAEMHRQHIETIQKASKSSQKIKDVHEIAVIEKDANGKHGVALVHSEPVLVKRERMIERGDWRAAAYLIEKSDPDQFGPRAQLSVKNLGFDPADLSSMSLEELQELKAQFLGGELEDYDDDDDLYDELEDDDTGQ